MLADIQYVIIWVTHFLFLLRLLILIQLKREKLILAEGAFLCFMLLDQFILDKGGHRAYLVHYGRGLCASGKYIAFLYNRVKSWT